MKCVRDETFNGYHNHPVRHEEFVVTSCSYRRALIICRRLGLHMKGSKKKNSPRWTGTMKAGYSRRKRVLYVNRYSQQRAEQEQHT